ncbi:MAG: hypothetical protein CGU28_12090 [Candidatus Dactylopiibacterium carminicum]|uniref:Uncharacterized protein n=1 Tax=Candidatus Dactylopiibacterium carminicum TaxID=857335 RepID=A0A272EPZ0_9RHOO|nr:hypothetical protein [Candidatus Dactylopiibacterium carminicum]KAF7598384.1 hypothetical protein BGI27_13390 [Candidatus Dactylopiibacterium carminicum]PAS92131.1 MAG: hypothetical protein CGU29_12760 [Candidatus Dactylopiibacterium carminicum]PAS95558.1 MAG: hypothetical protein CGU28_12090 [Candidatus Dactylopiibacterium carminicum]PAS97547.1 MAG: hypothetical protein BSR46_13410 [Candidatus Dactylopiibacterium carminicum]
MDAQPVADTFGFTQAAHRISTTGLTRQVNQIALDCYRSAGILRVLRLSLLNGDKDEVSLFDVQAAVEAALAAMPNPDGESFNAIDDISSDINQAVRSLLQRQQAVADLLEAMEVAARMDRTLEEINEAANTAYGVVAILPDGQRHWDAFCELIVRRGLSVEMIDLGPGFGPRPQINNPETLKLSKVVQRRTKAFARAVHAQSAAIALQSKPAKRRKEQA